MGARAWGRLLRECMYELSERQHIVLKARRVKG